MKRNLLGAAAIAVLAIAGCAGGGGVPSPQLTFSNYAPIQLNVQSATVGESYLVPNDPKDISGQFVIAPAEAVKRYAANRFNARGTGNGSFTIVIEDARVHLRQIAQNNKVLQWADVGTEDEYRVHMQLRVTPQPDGFNGRMGATTIKMDRTLIMPSSVTLTEREMRQVKFLEKLIADIDVRINETLDATPSIR